MAGRWDWRGHEGEGSERFLEPTVGQWQKPGAGGEGLSPLYR